MPDISEIHTILTDPAPDECGAAPRPRSHRAGLFPEGPPDLRRRDARRHAEQIAERAQFLPRHERCLITAFYEQGRNIAELAALSGQSPRSLRREIRRVLARLTSPEFAFVVVNLDRWPSTMRRVAQSCVLDGVPVRRASQTLRLSLHTVRKHRETIRMLAVGERHDLAVTGRGRPG
jgi:hypothetical protein